MKSNKTVRKALWMSVLSIALCLTMLVGTTFAWFTDTATTAVNRIQSGTLKVDIVDENGTSIKGGTMNFVNANGSNDILWEPGVTFKTPVFKIKSTGSLALKYKLVLNGVTGDNKLLEVIKFTVVDANDQEVALDTFVGHLTPDNALSGALYIKGHMEETAGNDYQDKKLDGLGITVLATQDTVESDSINDQYDKNATYPVLVSRDSLNSTLTLDDLKDASGNVSPVEVTLGDTAAEDITYSENHSGYTGKGVLLGSTNLNSYAAAPAAAGEYSFTFKNGTVTSTATGYASIDNFKDTSVYMLVPGNSDVVFENMTFNGVVSFDIQKYTSPWSNLNSITFKNCTFNGIIIGTCPASNVTFDGCTFNKYENTTSANNSNPIWWREDTEGSGDNANPIKTFTFVNNTVVGTRPVKIERIGKTVSPVFTIKNNQFDISKQTEDTVTKNMAINIGMGENPNLPFTLIDEGNTISSNTAALYTASLTGGSNWYKEVSGMKVLDGNGNAKTITAMVWKTTTAETFALKSVD